MKQYADSMRIGNLGGASYALINMKRKVRIDNINDSFEQFSNRLSLIKKELYENFGNIDELREEVVRNTKAEHDQMEAARIRMEKEAKVERERLQEFHPPQSGPPGNSAPPEELSSHHLLSFLWSGKSH